MKWRDKINELTDLLVNQKRSYEEVGRIFGCSGSNIKEVCIRYGIPVEQKRKINPNEHFNKGTGKKRYCEYCGKELRRGQYKYCSNKCQGAEHHDLKVKKWLSGENNEDISINVRRFIKQHLIDTRGEKCEICGWCEKNQFTGNIPIEVHHIDGDYMNNNPENLQLLCPNCHSLTETYKNHNKNGRKKRSVS